MGPKALVIDYTYCSGCHTCIIACQQENHLEVGMDGIVLHQIGPRQIPNDKPGERWEYDYVPIPTELCDFCESRVEHGKKPACVHHCQALCMHFGTLEELTPLLSEGRKMALYVK